MTQALPASIVAGLKALGTALAIWSATHHEAPLAAHEAGVLAAVRAALPQLLGAVVQTSTTALAPEQARVRQPCPRCGTRQTGGPRG